MGPGGPGGGPGGPGGPGGWGGGPGGWGPGPGGPGGFGPGGPGWGPGPGGPGWGPGPGGPWGPGFGGPGFWPGGFFGGFADASTVFAVVGYYKTALVDALAMVLPLSSHLLAAVAIHVFSVVPGNKFNNLVLSFFCVALASATIFIYYHSNLYQK
ncbi:glycine-rich cell wall structural protein-like [Gossypium australe]|uniref:Glycine-rich cell wall structural protein-like n=1 Tax=Gossypium australe TaxID=47621 RepID=A0A5B6W122_9ROSI|nr:glycine-rich cell wall structural protein-like [Gossypium australe]